jgi:hypothetical protein
VQDQHRAAAAPSWSAPWERTSGPASEARRRPYLLHQTKQRQTIIRRVIGRGERMNPIEQKGSSSKTQTTDKRPAHARARAGANQEFRTSPARSKRHGAGHSLPPDLRVQGTAMCAATSAALTAVSASRTTHTLPVARSLVFSFSPSRGKAPAPS